MNKYIGKAIKQTVGNRDKTQKHVEWKKTDKRIAHIM